MQCLSVRVLMWGRAQRARLHQEHLLIQMEKHKQIRISGELQLHASYAPSSLKKA